MSNHQPLELAVEPYRNLQPVGDQVSPFLFVVDSYQNKHWLIPPHQRKPDAWDAAKQRLYVERLKRSQAGNHPPGVFVTYQVTPASPVFLKEAAPLNLARGAKPMDGIA